MSLLNLIETNFCLLCKGDIHLIKYLTAYQFSLWIFWIEFATTLAVTNMQVATDRNYTGHLAWHKPVVSQDWPKVLSLLS